MWPDLCYHGQSTGDRTRHYTNGKLLLRLLRAKQLRKLAVLAVARDNKDENLRTTLFLRRSFQRFQV